MSKSLPQQAYDRETLEKMDQFDVFNKKSSTNLGSGLIDQSQKATAAAMQIAEK
jgi:hypothetical protein